MSGWLKCCGILDHATDTYLACYGSREKYFLLSNTGRVVSPCEFQRPENGEGKTRVDKVGTAPQNGLSRST